MLNFPSIGMAGKSLNIFFGQGRQLQFGFYKEAASHREDHILVATQVTALKGSSFLHNSEELNRQG